LVLSKVAVENLGISSLLVLFRRLPQGRADIEMTLSDVIEPGWSFSVCKHDYSRGGLSSKAMDDLKPPVPPLCHTISCPSRVRMCHPRPNPERQSNDGQRSLQP
jgi:hypothetical protein